MFIRLIVDMDTFHCLVLVLLLSVNFCLQSVESEETCWFKCDKNKKCVYHPKEGRKVCVLKRCLKPKSQGFCRRYTQRYYFDHKTFECKCFKYGGCYGSRNNFLTKHACESRCFPPPLEKPYGFSPALPDSTAPPSDNSPIILTLTTAPTTPTFSGTTPNLMTSLATATSMAITALTTPTATMVLTAPTNTNATTQIANTTNVATSAPTSLTGITAPTASTAVLDLAIQGDTPSLTTMTATMMSLGVLTTIVSTSPTATVPPTTTAAPTTPISTMVLTTLTNIVNSTSPQQASTCNDVPSVIGLTFFPSGGANISDIKAYRCAERNQTFAVYSFVSMVCPIIICHSDGTYLPVPNNTCTVPLNVPPGDNTLTVPGTITSPGYDGTSPYQDREAQYRWNIVTVGHTISIHFNRLDLPNGSSYCARGQGDVIEIYCGFNTTTADRTFCNSMMPPTTIFCQQSCIVILLLLKYDYYAGVGFSLTWSLVN